MHRLRKLKRNDDSLAACPRAEYLRGFLIAERFQVSESEDFPGAFKISSR